MTVYVDDIVTYPNKPHGHEKWCHMACDGDIEELHAMADRIKLRRSWFQDGQVQHYDLTPSKRTLAVINGAVEVDRRTLHRKCWAPFLDRNEMKGE